MDLVDIEALFGNITFRIVLFAGTIAITCFILLVIYAKKKVSSKSSEKIEEDEDMEKLFSNEDQMTDDEKKDDFPEYEGFFNEKGKKV